MPKPKSAIILPDTARKQAIADARAFFEERTSDLAAICYHDEFPSGRKFQ